LKRGGRYAAALVLLPLLPLLLPSLLLLLLLLLVVLLPLLLMLAKGSGHQAWTSCSHDMCCTGPEGGLSPGVLKQRTLRHG
jgi:hypothetical protein